MEVILKNRCRVCFEADQWVLLRPLADKDTRKLLEDCTTVKVHLSANTPTHLCIACYNKCVSWQTFKSQAILADEKINQQIKIGSGTLPSEVKQEQVARNAPTTSVRPESEYVDVNHIQFEDDSDSNTMNLIDERSSSEDEDGNPAPAKIEDTCNISTRTRSLSKATIPKAPAPNPDAERVCVKCVYCKRYTMRGALIKLLPCEHKAHESCHRNADADRNVCPSCLWEIDSVENVRRTTYQRHSNEDRELVVKAARNGKDWLSMIKVLGIKRTTAEHWIQTGSITPKSRGNNRPKLLNEARVQMIIEWLENEHPRINLQRSISERLLSELGMTVSVTTISRYLHGKLVMVKKWQQEDPIEMNSLENKRMRKEYVEKLLQYMEDGKYIIWVDEINFNLFLRREITTGTNFFKKSRLPKMPKSLGPNICVIGCISTAGVEVWEVNGRANGDTWTNEDYNTVDWLSGLAASLLAKGIALENVVLNCDHAAAHIRLQSRVEELGLTLLRRGAYSPMLNPLEEVWSLVKAKVKSANLTVVKGSNAERLQFMEDTILQTLPEITPLLCSQAVDRLKQLAGRVLDMEDMPIGN